MDCNQDYFFAKAVTRTTRKACLCLSMAALIWSLAGCTPATTGVREDGALNGTGQEASSSVQAAGAKSNAGLRAADPAHSIYFASGSSVVDAQGLRKLRAVAEVLTGDEDRAVLLVGHTDNLGSSAFNLAVAEKRVNEVARLLRSHGVAALQIRSYPVGDEKVPAGCRSESCRKQMRRVDIVFEE